MDEGVLVHVEWNLHLLPVTMVKRASRCRRKVGRSMQTWKMLGSWDPGSLFTMAPTLVGPGSCGHPFRR